MRFFPGGKDLRHRIEINGQSHVWQMCREFGNDSRELLQVFVPLLVSSVAVRGFTIGDGDGRDSRQLRHNVDLFPQDVGFEVPEGGQIIVDLLEGVNNNGVLGKLVPLIEIGWREFSGMAFLVDSGCYLEASTSCGLGNPVVVTSTGPVNEVADGVSGIRWGSVDEDFDGGYESQHHKETSDEGPAGEKESPYVMVVHEEDSSEQKGP